MRISVILSTYNQPQWLEKALWGYSVQSHRDFELIIADDGSGEATRQVIHRMRGEADLAIKHVWHEDRGFRKCTILNRAIEQSVADYLVFSDGDCIPRWDMLATHAAHAKERFFLSGGYFKLPLGISRAIDREDIVQRRVTDAKWLIRQGLPWTRKIVKLVEQSRVARWLDALTTTKASWNGHNASGWKADIVRVNGFDERMEWGAEDREMGERMMNLGLRGIRIRHQAICVHLDHDRGYVRDEALVRNREIRRETQRNRAVWTDYGILKRSHPLVAATLQAA
jgi:glycosyltransferase involved in cell wall biosynthesis